MQQEARTKDGGSKRPGQEAGEKGGSVGGTGGDGSAETAIRTQVSHGLESENLEAAEIRERVHPRLLHPCNMDRETDVACSMRRSRRPICKIDPGTPTTKAYAKPYITSSIETTLNWFRSPAMAPQNMQQVRCSTTLAATTATTDAHKLPSAFS